MKSIDVKLIEFITNFISENWKKINKDPVCFGLRDDSYGSFTITESGLINTFKLVHRSGSLKCRNKASASYWGCAQVKNKLITVITFKNGTALSLAEYGRYVYGCNYYTYHINGVDVDSPELAFNILPSPMPVLVGQEFQIWTARDLIDCGEDRYNSEPGRTCADVYAWYA